MRAVAAGAALVGAAVLLLYVAIVVCLRAAGVLVTDHTLHRLHVRELALVAVAVAVSAASAAPKPGVFCTTR